MKSNVTIVVMEEREKSYALARVLLTGWKEEKTTILCLIHRMKLSRVP